MSCESEVILLGDPVVYRDDIKGFDDVGVVVQANSSLYVLWNNETTPRIEIYERLRGARLDEVDAGYRVIREKF
ncbi:phosphohistidine phosphatase [Acinetobacter nosocomialis]|uniref:phosphohistidine phosphatase n=1 Tax=Acinetobacter nosocomialis TaxID=106654 RepID=UPI00280CA065|nr:phosphohistidine phosphatase [Acinetobacter nosocomialis]MDQ9029251.1 phosphohistidine phosphatase [Acinetobacter nosocomialis]MDQ9046525.1 phosphohistidine phosphatase [Acinetobacter nosocomialis]MDQ9083939.1 phosphohistidine phosphatase [Acinetobacter nosocomialis]